MEYRILGRSGLQVSPICLGTMMFGGQTDAAASERIVARAFEAGVNMIDTADVYNAGESERIVGRAIKANRRDWILATKAGNAMGKGPNRSGLSRRRIFEAVEESLQRLATDYIDVLYLHREDHRTAPEILVGALGDLVKSGKIRHFGISNFRAWRLAELCAVCDRLGIDRPVVSQPYYNAMNRMPEVEHLPACANFGLGVIPYSPLARGVLTGKYDPEAPPSPQTRAGRNDKRMMESEWRIESLQIAQKIKAHATEKGITAGQFAVCWVLNNALVSGTIAGPRTEDQLEDYLAALHYRFDADDERLVNDLVVTGHPSTPGYNDPSYVIEGRVPRTG